MYSQPLAYLLTFSCYGTWLHGNERGSVDKDHCKYGTEFVPVDAERERNEFLRLKHPPVVLDSIQRENATGAIQELCSRRQWNLYEINVRTNHAHIVIEAKNDPKRMLSGVKAAATKQLREAGLFAATATIWTRGGSRRYLWKEDDVQAAKRYVREQ